MFTPDHVERRDRLLAFLGVALLLVALVVARLLGFARLDPPDPVDPASISFRVDINHADAAELQLLPGVGPSLADRIITHRTTRGPLRSPDDLLKIPGIARKTADRIAPYVVFGAQDPMHDGGPSQ